MRVRGQVHRWRTGIGAGIRAGGWLVILLLAVEAGMGATPSKLVRQGNEAFRGGDYETALRRYEEAAAELPESAEISFNRGAAFYGQGEFERAMEEFQEAALRAKEPKLASAAKYNQGNSAFRQAESQREGELGKAIEGCRRAIESYQEALRLDPANREAAENIEVARLTLKTMLDEQQKQEEEEEQQNELAERLQELIERQATALRENGELEERREESSAEVWRSESEALASGQENLQADTGTLREEVARLGGQMSQDQAEDMEKLIQVQGHLDRAIEGQAQSVPRLRTGELPVARTHQERALEELVKALQALSDPPSEDQQQQDQESQQGEAGQDEQQEQQSGQEGQEGQEGQDGEEGRNEEEGDEGEEEEMEPEGRSEDEDDEQSRSEEEAGEEMTPEEQEASEEETAERAILEAAHDILREEEQNRDRRMVPLRGVRPVERDW